MASRACFLSPACGDTVSRRLPESRKGEFQAQGLPVRPPQASSLQKCEKQRFVVRAPSLYACVQQHRLTETLQSDLEDILVPGRSFSLTVHHKVIRHLSSQTLCCLCRLSVRISLISSPCFELNEPKPPSFPVCSISQP